MNPAFDIVGIGVCTVDHLVTVPRMPHRNENMRALNYARQPGGLASIALVAAARLGTRAKVIARIGDDDNGEYIRGVLAGEGLDVSQLLVEPDTESHVSVILVDEASGDRSIITRPPTGTAVSPSEFTREDITAARVLFIDTLNDATMQAARWAKEAGMQVLLDPALPYAEIKPLLEFVDVPIVPEYWARAWLPDQPPSAAAERLHAEGAKIAIVTLGEQGRGRLLGRGQACLPRLQSGCCRYDRRGRCLSRRVHGRAAAGLGCAAHGAIRRRRWLDELPRDGRAQRLADAGGSRPLHRRLPVLMPKASGLDRDRQSEIRILLICGICRDFISPYPAFLQKDVILLAEH